MTLVEFIDFSYVRKRKRRFGWRRYSAAVLALVFLFLGAGRLGLVPRAAYGAMWQGFRTEPASSEGKKAVQIAVGYRKGSGFFLQAFEDTPVRVHVDGTTVITRANLPPLEDILQNAGVELGTNDRAEARIVTGESKIPEIEVIRVRNRIVTEKEPIPYPVKKVRDPRLEVGKTRLCAAGREGILLQKFEITTENGVVVEKRALGSEVLREPEPRVIAYGTKAPQGVERVASRGAPPEGARRVLQVVATAYTHTGRPTASGVMPYVGGVAVDPRVIPLGTRLYVEGYGLARAVDTGGLIKGNRIDVFLETAEECYAWGKRTVNVYILD